MSLTRLAVYRPVTTLMASLIVVLLGWIALTRLSVDLMPEVSYPTISVSALYPGAGPEEIETLITRPLEQALSSVNGVDRLSSSSSEGAGTVRVRLQWGVNLDAAVADMRQAIEKIRDNLPEEIEDPYIQRYDVADSPIIYLGLSSDISERKLAQLAEHTIVPALSRLQGVARVSLRGEVHREIQVDLDRNKLESLNMGIAEVVAALERENVNQPAGDFDEGHVKRLIRSHGEFHTLDDIAGTTVRQSEGALVRISDIGEVIDGEEERTELARVNGQPGVFVYIFKQAGANTVDVSDRVRAEVERLNLRLPDAELAVRMDKSEFIRQAISNVRLSAMYGMGLAVVVLVLFLHSFRSVLIIGVSMPLSVLATFVLIYFQGFTLNLVSFGGLALGIGLLVDNSIVVLESIFRKRDDGLDAKTAAIEGTQEVASAIVASTLTTLIVFLPLLFISGLTGVLLHQLAWVVSFSLVCSLLTSLTLTPVLCAYWMGEETAGNRNILQRMLYAGAHGFHSINRWVFQFVETAYAGLLKFSLRRPGIVGALLLAGLTTTLGLAPRIGTEFIPKADEGELRISALMAPGIQLDQLNRQTQRVERIIMDNVPEANVTAAFVGEEVDEAEEWNTSRFRVKLKPRSERVRGIEEIRKDLDAKIGPIPGMKVRVQASNEMYMFRMLSRRNSNGGDLAIEIRGHDQQTAEQLAEVVAKTMQGVAGLVNVEVEKEDRRPELAANIDRAKANLLGVSVRDVTQVLESTIRGTFATTYRDEGDEYRVLVRLREPDRNRVEDVEQVGITTEYGRIVPLKSVVHFSNSEAPVLINRLDQQRIITITADVEDRDLGSAVGALQAKLNTIAIPEGFTFNIAGDWEEKQKSFKAMREGLILAVVLMYMIMASQFESLRDPLLILLTIPLGAIGVILMLVATETSLNVQSFIGLIMLAGIVVNNAIVLVDYINQLRRAEPDTPITEIITRASIRRFRPILMTTLTTVLAMLPIALGVGEGGELQAPMARVVIGGLTSGTLITLLAIPLVYRRANLGRSQ